MIFLTCVCVELLHHGWVFVVVVETSQESWFPIQHRHDGTLSWAAGAALDQPPQTQNIKFHSQLQTRRFCILVIIFLVQMTSGDLQKPFYFYCDAK